MDDKLKVLLVLNLINNEKVRYILKYFDKYLMGSVELYLAYIVSINSYLTPSIDSLEEKKADRILLGWKRELNLNQSHVWRVYGSLSCAAQMLSESLKIKYLVIDNNIESIENLLIQLKLDHTDNRLWRGGLKKQEELAFDFRENEK